MVEIESVRRTRRWAASRITIDLRKDGTMIARRTVTRIPRNPVLIRRRLSTRTAKPIENQGSSLRKRVLRWSASTSNRSGRPSTVVVGVHTSEDPSRPNDPSVGNEEQARLYRPHLPVLRDRRDYISWRLRRTAVAVSNVSLPWPRSHSIRGGRPPPLTAATASLMSMPHAAG